MFSKLIQFPSLDIHCILNWYPSIDCSWFQKKIRCVCYLRPLTQGISSQTAKSLFMVPDEYQVCWLCEGTAIWGNFQPNCKGFYRVSSASLGCHIDTTASYQPIKVSLAKQLYLEEHCLRILPIMPRGSSQLAAACGSAGRESLFAPGQRLWSAYQLSPWMQRTRLERAGSALWAVAAP